MCGGRSNWTRGIEAGGEQKGKKIGGEEDDKEEDIGGERLQLLRGIHWFGSVW